MGLWQEAMDGWVRAHNKWLLYERLGLGLMWIWDNKSVLNFESI